MSLYIYIGSKSSSWMYYNCWIPGRKWHLFSLIRIACLALAPKKVSSFQVCYTVLPTHWICRCFPNWQIPVQQIDFTLWWRHRFHLSWLECFTNVLQIWNLDGSQIRNRKRKIFVLFAVRGVLAAVLQMSPLQWVLWGNCFWGSKGIFSCNAANGYWEK